MKNPLYLLILLMLLACNSTSVDQVDFTIPFEKSNGSETSTYEEVINFYTALSKEYPQISIHSMGLTDSGEPLHLVIYAKGELADTDLKSLATKNVVLINNGIHPGESDGIDASMLLIRDLAQGTITTPKNTVVAVIPVYNIGGALNRNSYSRTNQNGPEEYGFRGNARNFDLNRDFIKADTKNANAFAEIFHRIKPNWFIDNHVSNGADYQYTLTHLFSQHNKLGGELGDYLMNSFQKQLEDSLSQKNWDITPYVNVFNQTPEKGFSQFMDHPRYSTGYTTLFHTVGMMVETHMLKPYKQRVEGTYELMKSFIAIADKDAEKVASLQKKAASQYTPGKEYPIQWKVDSSQMSNLAFKGFEGSMENSNITGFPRLKYHRDQPFTKTIAYYNYFIPSETITIPSYYIIPKGYWNVIQQLQQNDIALTEIKKDTIISAEVYTIESYQTFSNPYEGHYPHYNTKTKSSQEAVHVKKGDVLVTTQQNGVRYILETLEPAAMDSFFKWNYFDAILQQKEGFSPYVWEDLAWEFLAKNPAIKTEFEQKKENDPAFSQNWYVQLDWIHKKSPYYEKAHLRYPIVRVKN